jgi:hypothetical protein
VPRWVPAKLHGASYVDTVTEGRCWAARDSFVAIFEGAATTLPGLRAKAAYLQDLARREAWMFELMVEPVRIVEGFSASIETVSAMA